MIIELNIPEKKPFRALVQSTEMSIVRLKVSTASYVPKLCGINLISSLCSDTLPILLHMTYQTPAERENLAMIRKKFLKIVNYLPDKMLNSIVKE